MHWESLLGPVIYGFHATLGSRNFAHFLTYIRGAIFCEHRHRVTDIYLAGKAKRSYWALVKFLGRAKWDAGH